MPGLEPGGGVVAGSVPRIDAFWKRWVVHATGMGNWGECAYSCIFGIRECRIRFCEGEDFSGEVPETTPWGAYAPRNGRGSSDTGEGGEFVLRLDRSAFRCYLRS